MNPPPRQPMKRVMPAQAVNKIAVGKRPAVASTQPIGRSLLQPSTAFALSLATQNQRGGPIQAPVGNQGENARGQTPASMANALRVPEVTLGLILELTNLLTKEIQLIKKQDIEGINALLPQKHRLIGNYEANIKAIAANPELIKQASEELRQKLKIAGKKLEEITTQNASMLKGALMAIKRLVQNIIGMIREESAPMQSSYSNRRGSKILSGAYSPLCPSVAVNRTA